MKALGPMRVMSLQHSESRRSMELMSFLCIDLNDIAKFQEMQQNYNRKCHEMQHSPLQLLQFTGDENHLTFKLSAKKIHEDPDLLKRL